MNYLSTSASSVTFTNAQGVSKTITKNYIWYRIFEDTVTFLVLPDADPGGDGTCFFASLIENLTINGTVYTSETIVEALDDIFEPVNVTDVYTKEQIDELLDNYAELDDLNEFIDADELATVLGDYQEKLTAGTNITIENNVISATGGGGSVTVDSTWIPNSTNPAESQLIQSALGDKADKSTTYTKTETDNLLNGKVSTGTLATVAASGSYTDLINTPTIPAAQVQSSWTESDTSSKAYILGKPSLAAVATSGAYSDLSGTPDLSTKQDTLVSGTNIKTVNGNSILGSGNIEISSGGTQVQSDWTEADTASMAYIQHKPSLATVATSGAYSDLSGTPTLATVATSGSYNDLTNKPTIPTVPTNVSAFVNDAGYLTSHQSLADVFGDVLYDSQTKHINFYGKGDTSHTTVLAYVDAANFIVDGMVDTVEVKNATVSGQTVLCLVISFNTDAGKQDINIPISQIFDASNYYTKSETDTLLSGKASTNSLATVATTGAYSDLTGTPSIPAAQVNSDWDASSGVAQILNKPDLSNYVTSSDVTDEIESFMTLGWDASYDIDPDEIGVSINATGPGIYTDQNSETHYLIPTAMTVNQNDDMAVSGDAVYTALSGKQDTLYDSTTVPIGGTANLKTINNQSLLGSGNITISGGGSGTVTAVKMNNGSAINPDANGVVDLGTVVTTVDSALNASSTNPVENRAVYAAIGDIESALQAINGTTPSNP